MDLIESLNWRYATKAYTNEIVPDEKVDFILKATRLSASSFGLQPYRIFSINNQELKAKLGATSFNKQIASSSHLLVFCTYNQVTVQHVEDYVNLVADVQKIDVESLAGMKAMMSGYVSSLTPEVSKSWAEKQTYIALGTALVAAADASVDATPMEGFDGNLFNEILELKELGLHSSVILSLGYRDPKDTFIKMPKIRRPLSELVTEL